MSVLLYRAKTACEIFNDANGDIVNWWRCIQELKQNFIDKIEATPYSRAELEKARGILSEKWTLTDYPNLRRGHAVYMYLMNTQKKVLLPNGVGASFSLNFSGPGGKTRLWGKERLAALSERIRQTQLERTDGIALLERCATRSHIVAYVDPPYRGSASGGSDYGFTVDYDALSDVLSRMAGKVAISGYGDEWNHLGWHKYEKQDTSASISGGGMTSAASCCGQIMTLPYTALHITMLCP